MFKHSALRVAFILVYFLACTACGHPADDEAQPGDEQGTSSVYSSDVNFVGSGSQIPESNVEEEPYHSITLSTPPPPGHLTWLASIDQAVSMAERDRRIKIILWLRNDDCIECTQIERDVFTNMDVIAESANWYFIKVDTERNIESARDLLHGADPPALVFLDNRGFEYDRFYGTFTAEELKTMLIRGKA